MSERTLTEICEDMLTVLDTDTGLTKSELHAKMRRDEAWILDAVLMKLASKGQIKLIVGEDTVRFTAVRT